MNIVSDFLERNRLNKIKMHIFGDTVIDQHYDVKVTRISPESPNVCVMLSGDEQPSEEHPGGAANICYQLANFNTENILFTYLDQHADMVLRRAGIDPRGFVGLPSGISPKKKRFYHNGIQVGDRWDIERPNYGMTSLQLQKELLGALHWPFAYEADVIILSDYDKGFFKDGIPTKLPKDIPIIVDPKRLPLGRWKNCTVFKPNATEAANLSGCSDWRNQCSFFQTELGCKAVVITQEGEGVVGKDGNEFFEYRPTSTVEASKVVGAGDCFIGIFGLALGHGFTIAEAANIAFEAGSVYVQNRSRSPLTPWQLQKKSKFVTPHELVDRDFKLVFTNGCFDILHSGHLESLRFAKSKGGKLVVAVNSDSSVKRLKGPMRPVVPLDERMQMLAAMEVVDYVISFEEDSPLDLIKQIKPDVLIKGSDWKNKGGAVGSDYVKEVFFAPLIEDKSTTNLIEKIRTLISQG